MSEQQLRTGALSATLGACTPDGHCITCSDQALPARVVQVDAATGLALVALEAGMSEVDISLIDEVVPGDWVLVHAGIAMGRAEDAHDQERG